MPYAMTYYNVEACIKDGGVIFGGGLGGSIPNLIYKINVPTASSLILVWALDNYSVQLDSLSDTGVALDNYSVQLDSLSDTGVGPGQLLGTAGLPL
jgi:hypothetical protein